MYQPASSALTPPPPVTGKRRPCVLWLHTQPEHYFNRMMDDLATGHGYTVPGQSAIPHEGEYDYVAVFSGRGPGWYENNQPAHAKTIFLRTLSGADQVKIGKKVHQDWKADLRDVAPDVVIVSGYAIRTHREVIDDCRRRGIPVALWSDSNLRSQRGRGLKARLKRRLKKRWLKPLVAKCDFQLTSNRLGVAYWRYFGAPKDHIRLCPYYADYVRVDDVKGRSRAHVLERIGLAATDRILFSAARLVEVKGLDLMIDAFLRGGFAERGYIYVIAGVGPLEAALKAQAGAALGKSIFFIGFQQPADNLALMAQSDLLVLPSRYEPHGIVVQEALAAGTPVLASDVVGAAADLVGHGCSGILFKSGDGADLLRKLQQFLETPEKLAAIRAGARPAFEAWYRETSPLRVVPEMVARMLSSRGREAGAGGGRA